MVAQVWRAKSYGGGPGATSSSDSRGVATQSSGPGDGENVGSADGNTPSFEPGEASSGRDDAVVGVSNEGESGQSWYERNSWGYGWSDSSWSREHDYGWSWNSGWGDYGWRPHHDGHVARVEETTWVRDGKWQGRTGYGPLSRAASGSTRGEEADGSEEPGRSNGRPAEKIQVPEFSGDGLGLSWGGLLAAI